MLLDNILVSAGNMLGVVDEAISGMMDSLIGSITGK